MCVLRVSAQRSAAARKYAGTLGLDLHRRFTFFNPVHQGAQAVHAVGGGTALAMAHAWHQKQLGKVRGGGTISGLQSLVIVDHFVSRKYRIGQAVDEHLFATARLEAGQLHIVGCVEDPRMGIHALRVTVKIKLINAQAAIGRCDKVALQGVLHQEHMT